MRVGPEGAVGLRETAGTGGGEGCGVGVALGVDTCGTFVNGFGRSLGFGVKFSGRGPFTCIWRRGNLDQSARLLIVGRERKMYSRSGSFCLGPAFDLGGMAAFGAKVDVCTLYNI